MTLHFRRELEKIKKRILVLGALVEDRVILANKAITTCDKKIAQKVIAFDHEVDKMEVEVEEECLKILALHQPVASDLRFLVAVIKINKDLERIADQAVNCSERIISMSKRKSNLIYPFDYSQMIQKVEYMLRKSLDSLINLDLDLAINICRMDDEVDEIKGQAYLSIIEGIKKHPEHIKYLLNLYLISRHLERSADLAKNIAEEVIYMIEGEIVRHGKKVLVEH